MLITRTARQMLERMLSPWDYSLVRRSDLDRIPDVSPEFRAIVDRVKPATMTTPERIIGLCRALEYVVRNQIHGDFVECGVYKGGSTMAAALTLLHLGVPDRTLCLFDTFEGMSSSVRAGGSACWMGYIPSMANLCTEATVCKNSFAKRI